EKCERRALEVTQKLPLMEKPQFEANGMRNIAHLLSLQGSHAEAAKLARQAVQHLEKAYGSEARELHSALTELATIQEAAGKLADARQTMDRALSLPRDRRTPYDLAQRAHLAWKEGQKPDAVSSLAEALDLFEQSRARATGGEQERAHFFERPVDFFAQMVGWQAELGKPAEAFQAAERARARTLLDQLEVRGVDLLAGLSFPQAERLRQRERQSRIRVASLEKQLRLLAGEKTLPIAERQERQKKLSDELTEAQRDLQSTYRDIRQASPAYSSAVRKDHKPPSLDSLRKWAVANSALLLQYVVASNESFVIVVPGDGGEPRVEKLRVTADQARVLATPAGSFGLEQLNEEIAALLPLLSRPGRTTEAIPRLAALWPLLVPSAQRELLNAGKVKRLVVIPDGPLTMLPFEALVLDAKEPRYLLDVGTPVLYAPSAAVLLNLSERPATALRAKQLAVLTLGDPAYPDTAEPPAAADPLLAAGRFRSGGGKLARLPGSARESKALAEQLKKCGGPILQLLGAEATEKRLRAAIAGQHIVHLACHGLVDQTWGNFFGALALTPGPKGVDDPNDDGFLTLGEIYALDLHACELAILSACRTNVGPQQRGEGSWGLSRGFLSAGARRVIASNWLVEDQAASELVDELSQRLATAVLREQAPDPVAALHAAKLRVRKQEKWSAPCFWASMVILGAP
ncbi:MAG TPA: CHAT domain-containing protein, partial [Gemmataceae bacterium]|nr:CHAT domain-containing protein [Gemmataceae bacterium]